MQSCELKIPATWGHIAIKAWGDSTNEVAIFLHGLLDNAGSFDRLIPLLPQNFYYLCVDLPGHGFSSHFPTNLPVYFTNYLLAIRTVTDYFKRNKYVLVGHSFGGRISLLYTQLYPEIVSKITVLDTIYALLNTPKLFMSSLKDAFDILNESSFNSASTPSYSYDEIVNKIMKGRFAGTLTFETAEQLAQRMIRQVGDNRYEFTYDRRLRKTIIYPNYSEELVEDMLRNNPIRCPAMLIYSTDSKKTYYGKFFEIPNFKLIEVDGHHHSHHTNPQIFVPILSNFLLEKRSKL